MSLVVDLGRALAQFGDPRFLRVLAWSLMLTVWRRCSRCGYPRARLMLPDMLTLPCMTPDRFLDDLAFRTAVGLMRVLSMLRYRAKAAVFGFFLDGAAAVEAPSRAAAGEGSWDAMGILGLVVAVNLVAPTIHRLVPPLAPPMEAAALARRYFWRCGRGTAMTVPLSVPVLNRLPGGADRHPAVRR